MTRLDNLRFLTPSRNDFTESQHFWKSCISYYNFSPSGNHNKPCEVFPYCCPNNKVLQFPGDIHTLDSHKVSIGDISSSISFIDVFWPTNLGRHHYLSLLYHRTDLSDHQLLLHDFRAEIAADMHAGHLFDTISSTGKIDIIVFVEIRLDRFSTLFITSTLPSCSCRFSTLKWAEVTVLVRCANLTMCRTPQTWCDRFWQYFEITISTCRWFSCFLPDTCGPCSSCSYSFVIRFS